MPKSTKHNAQPCTSNSSPRSKKDDTSEFDRAPRQKSQDRDPVKSAEQTKTYPHQAWGDQIAVVLLVCDVLQPHNVDPVLVCLLQGEVSHGSSRRRTMPVTFLGRNPNRISRTNRLRRFAE